MNNWDDYRILLAINKGKSLRNAAQILGVNHSTVSRRLLTLNSKFGNPLVEPSQNGLILTEIGKRFLNTANEIERLVLDDMQVQHASSLALSGCIKLSLPPAIFQYLLFDELYRFQQDNKNIQLNIDSTYDIVDLDRCEADIVIRVSNQPPEHLIGHRLFPIGVNCFAAKGYFDDKGESELKWITPCFEGESPQWIASSPYPRAGIGLRIDDLVLRHQAASRGYGMIRGASYIAKSFSDLIPINSSETGAHQDIWILTHPELIKIPRIKHLMSCLKNTLRLKKSLIS